MSLRMARLILTRISFPRVSGDEPRVQAVFDRYNAFSPRERG